MHPQSTNRLVQTPPLHPALHKTQCISSVLALDPGLAQSDMPDSHTAHTMQAMQKSLLPSQSMTNVFGYLCLTFQSTGQMVMVGPSDL